MAVTLELEFLYVANYLWRFRRRAGWRHAVSDARFRFHPGRIFSGAGGCRLASRAYLVGSMGKLANVPRLAPGAAALSLLEAAARTAALPV